MSDLELLHFVCKCAKISDGVFILTPSSKDRTKSPTQKVWTGFFRGAKLKIPSEIFPP